MIDMRLPIFLAIAALALAACEPAPAPNAPVKDPPPVEDDAPPAPAPDEAGEDENVPPADPSPTPPDQPDDFLTDNDGREFSYLPVGELLPASGSGHADATIYRPDIVFPLEDPAFLNSQVYRHGGFQGPAGGFTGGQCDPTNYDYPWQDTFCESRGRSQIMCTNGGHEGVDIRAASCIPQTSGAHWAIAVEDGRIIAPPESKYTVRLLTEDGTLYRYLHLKMDELAVTDGQLVQQGDRIGRVWNDFFDAAGDPVPTTYHLHFEMYQNYAPDDATPPVFDQINPYMTLVSAYERKLRGE